jgi:translocation and assembly module TamB
VEGRISIGNIDGILFNEVGIYNLLWTLDDDTLILLPELSVSYNPLALLREEISINYLDIHDPHIKLSTDSSGVWNFSRFISKSGNPDTVISSIDNSFGLKVRLKSFNLHNASVSLNTNEPLIPKKVSGLNIKLNGEYQPDHILIDLESLSFHTESPDFRLDKVAFEFEQNKDKIRIGDITVITKQNTIQSNIHHLQNKKSHVSLESKRLDFNEVGFILPDIHLKNNPDFRITSEYTDDLLQLEISLKHDKENLLILGRLNNYQTLLNESQQKTSEIQVDLSLQDIDLQNWSDLLPRTKLNGNVSIEGSFTHFEDLNASLRANFQKPEFEDYLAETIHMNANYQSGALSGELLVHSELAYLDLDLRIFNLPASPVYDGTFSIRKLNLGELLLVDSIDSDINLKLHFQGENILSPSNKLSIKSEIGPSYINNIKIDTLMTELNLQGTRYVLDTLHFQTLAGQFSGSGNGDFTSTHQINYSYQLGNLSKISELINADSLRAQGSLKGIFYGNSDALKNEIRFNLHDIYYNTIVIDTLSGESNTIILDSDPTVAFDLTAKNLAVGNMKLDRVDISSLYDEKELISETQVKFDANLKSSLKTKLQLDSIIVLSVPKIRIEFIDDKWEGNLEKLVYDPDQATLDLLNLNIDCITSEDQRRIFANGQLSATGKEDFQFIFEGVHPKNILNYLGKQTQIDSRMNFKIDLKGTADHTIYNGSLQFEEGSVGTINFRSINTSFDYRNDRLSFDYLLNFNDKDSLTASGYLPLHLSLADTKKVIDYNKPIDIEIKSEPIPISTIFQGLNILPEFSGIVLCDFIFSNTLANPNIEGSLEFKDGLFKSPYWGIDYRNINMKISALGNRFNLDQIQILGSSGSLKASGEIQFEFSEEEDKVIYSNMNLRADNFSLLSHRDFETLVDADIKYQMDGNKPTIGGYVNVNRSSFYLPALMNRAGYVTESEEEIKPLLISAHERQNRIEQSSTVEDVGSVQKDTLEVPGFIDLLEGELELRMPRNTWVRNQQLRVELGGRIKMNINKGDFSLKGPVDIVRGQYDLLGRRFIVNQGKIEFLGKKPINPPIYLEAEYVYRTVGREKRALIIEVTGNLEYPIINYHENNNPITREDALSIVMYGRKRDELNFGSQTELSELSGNVAAMGFVSGIVSDRLSRSVGDDLSLDIVEVNATDNWQSANFVVGKYLTQNIFVTYKREFGQNMDNNLNPETISMEYEIKRNFFFQMIQGSPQESGYDLLLRFNWD